MISSGLSDLSGLVGGLEYFFVSPVVGMMIQSDELHHFSGG